MVMFVHLATETDSAKIKRKGILRLRARITGNSGFFAMPVVRNFIVSHQWLRELKRRNRAAICGVYFRIPDNQLVWAGHYSGGHDQMTAAQASKLFDDATEDLLGWEVIIPQRVSAKAIHAIRKLPQILGWRYWPNSNGRRPFRGCDTCTRGRFGAKKIRAKYG